MSSHDQTSYTFQIGVYLLTITTVIQPILFLGSHIVLAFFR